jgi:acetyltransferase-like isoleucine patch superfamily enzyme
MLEQGYDFSPVSIGAGVAVTTKCSIIGASIGERAFIGANAVVTRDIPAFCLAVGAPAEPVEYFGPPDRRPPGVPVRG